MRRRYQEGGLAALDDDENEDADILDPEGDEADVPGGAITASGGLSVLDMPGAQEAFRLMQKSSADARKALQDARNTIMARKYGRTDALLAAAAALGAPTRTGTTAESFAAMAGALREPLAAKRAFEMQKQKDLLGVNTQLAGLDEREAAARLKLAELNASLAAKAATAGNDRVVGADGQLHYLSHADARKPGVIAWAPTPPAGTVVQQPLANGNMQPMRLDPTTKKLVPVGDEYVPPKLSAAGRQQALGKLQTVAILKQQLADIRKKWEPLKDSISAGYGQGWIPSEEGKQFDKAVAAARGTIRQLTRVPGEGSMSDWEGQLDQAKLPDRNDYESATEQSMDQLEKLLSTYEQTTQNMLGTIPTQAPAAPGVSAPEAPKVRAPGSSTTAEETTNPDDTAPATWPPAAEAKLRANPTPEMKRFFIEKYGALPDGVPL